MSVKVAEIIHKHTPVIYEEDEQSLVTEILNLIEDLVPKKKKVSNYFNTYYAKGYNKAISDFQSNIKKLREINK